MKYPGEGTKVSKFVAEQRNRDEARKGTMPPGWLMDQIADEKLRGGPGKLHGVCPECHLTHPANTEC
jgi:hypothetical protein